MIAVLACLSAAIAIAAGAFGAHGAAGPEAADWLRTGGIYQLSHAIAALAILDRSRGGAIMLLVGAAVFAGSLYLMALGLPRWLGAVTPVGGTLMIAGWLLAAFRLWGTRRRP